MQKTTGSVKKFRLLVPDFGFRAFVVAAGSLWLISLGIGYLAQVSTLLQAPAWIIAGLRLLSYIAGTVLVLLIFYRLWGLALRFGLFLWSLVSKMETVEVGLDGPANVEEAPEINHTIDELSHILDQLETDSNQARLLLNDAQTYALVLVELIQTVSLKAEAMVDETEGLNQALTAVTGGDPMEIALAAGAVKDEHIRSLLLSEVKNADYWRSVARLIAVQLGTLQQWEQGYRKFAGNLLLEVSKAKSRLAALQASNELSSAGRPLLQVQVNLNQAGNYLKLEEHPGLHRAAQSLPAANSSLLR